VATAETSYDRSSLISQAQTWDAQASVMAEMVGEAGGSVPTAEGSYYGEQGLSLGAPGGILAGLAIGDYPLFQAALNAYAKVEPQLAALAGQGHQQMVAIADALITATKRYDANEEGLAEASQNAVH
jgi:hypothetical protein